MNNLKKIICLLSLMGGLMACESDENVEDTPSQEVNLQIATGDVLDISQTTATLLGTINASPSSYSEFGIAYYPGSNSDDVTYTMSTDIYGVTGSQSFTTTISGLQPDADYTYYAYIKRADGHLIISKEQKKIHTKSPAILLEYSTMQWVAMRDATLCWDLTIDNTLGELTENQHKVSFGLVWSTNVSDVTPSGNQFSGQTQPVNAIQGEKAFVKLVSLKPGTTYYYTTYINVNGKMYAGTTNSFVTMSEDIATGTAPSEVKPVDMGLPSGTKWANMNVGAKNEESAGTFYAWGETVGFNYDGSDGHIFSWASYKWCQGSRTTQTKYCTISEYGTVDNKVSLDLTDDAAYINWGDNWRMPTTDEIQELTENTQMVWSTINGVVGYRFISNLNGNSIFLPAAGCRVSESHYEIGTDCYYWSSSLDENSPYASSYLRFYVGRVFVASLFRYYGMNIRPVQR